MILRLQSEQELELLQSRIKAKAKAINVHVNELRTNTGTDPEKGGNHVPGEYSRSGRRQLSGSHEVTGVASVKTRLRDAHKGHQSIFKPVKLPAVTQSALEAEFLLQVRSLKQALPRLQYQPFPDRKFRLDFAWPDRKVAVMVQGNVHRIKDKFYRDCELFCLLTVAGWRFLPISRRQIKSLEARSWIKRLLSAEP